MFTFTKTTATPASFTMIKQLPRRADYDVQKQTNAKFHDIIDKQQVQKWFDHVQSTLPNVNLSQPHFTFAADATSPAIMTSSAPKKNILQAINDLTELVLEDGSTKCNTIMNNVTNAIIGGAKKNSAAVASASSASSSANTKNNAAALLRYEQQIRRRRQCVLDKIMSARKQQNKTAKLNIIWSLRLLLGEAKRSELEQINNKMKLALSTSTAVVAPIMKKKLFSTASFKTLLSNVTKGWSEIITCLDSAITLGGDTEKIKHIMVQMGLFYHLENLPSCAYGRRSAAYQEVYQRLYFGNDSAENIGLLLQAIDEVTYEDTCGVHGSIFAATTKTTTTSSTSSNTSTSTSTSAQRNLVDYCRNNFVMSEPNDNDVTSFVSQSCEARQLLVLKVLDERARQRLADSQAAALKKLEDETALVLSAIIDDDTSSNDEVVSPTNISSSTTVSAAPSKSGGSISTKSSSSKISHRHIDAAGTAVATSQVTSPIHHHQSGSPLVKQQKKHTSTIVSF